MRTGYSDIAGQLFTGSVKSSGSQCHAGARHRLRNFARKHRPRAAVCRCCLWVAQATPHCCVICTQWLWQATVTRRTLSSIMRQDAHFPWQCHFDESSGVPYAGISFLPGTSPSKGKCGQRFVRMCRCTVAILHVRRMICSKRGARRWRRGSWEACVQENFL